MGGMIAQTLAARHPDRVASLCSMHVRPRGPAAGRDAADERDRHPARPPPAERNAYAAHVAKIFTRIGSPGYDAATTNASASGRC